MFHAGNGWLPSAAGLGARIAAIPGLGDQVLHRVRRMPQWAVLGADAAGGHGLAQVGLVHQAASGHVDQETARPQGLEHGGVDDAFGLVGRGAQHQRVGGACQVHQVRHEGLGHVIEGAQVGVADLATEGRGPLGHRPTHPAQADDAHVHAAETARQRDRAGLGVQWPLAVAHEAVARAQVAAGRDQQADGQVGHVLRQRAQRGGDRQAALPAIGQVDRIGADAIDRHDLEGGQLLQHGPRDAGVAAGDDGGDGAAVFTQPGCLVAVQFEVLVDGVARRELVVDRGNQDGVELQDLGFHGLVVRQGPAGSRRTRILIWT